MPLFVSDISLTIVLRPFKPKLKSEISPEWWPFDIDEGSAGQILLLRIQEHSLCLHKHFLCSVGPSFHWIWTVSPYWHYFGAWVRGFSDKELLPSCDVIIDDNRNESHGINEWRVAAPRHDIMANLLSELKQIIKFKIDQIEKSCHRYNFLKYPKFEHFQFISLFCSKTHHVSIFEMLHFQNQMKKMRQFKIFEHIKMGRIEKLISDDISTKEKLKVFEFGTFKKICICYHVKIYMFFGRFR